MTAGLGVRVCALKLSVRSALLPLCLALFLLIVLSLAMPAYGQVVRQDAAQLAGKTYPCVYKWASPNSAKPEAVIIAIHGLTLHGLIFDRLARHLAERNFVVFAPDLRGYGRWCQPANLKAKSDNLLPNVAYDQSRADLIELVKAAKSDYPNIPLYCIGESLGADLALFAAAYAPAAVDGLILSSPAIKRRLSFGTRFIADTAKLVTNPNRQIDLIPYMKKFASEDPRIVSETINDPLVRKKYTLWDLLRTAQLLKPALKYADHVKSNLPVLVIQGSNDKVLCSRSIIDLLSHLQSDDQTVKWFKNRGHLMLETSHLQADTLQMVDRWLDEHRDARKNQMQASEPSQIAEFTGFSFNQTEKD